jgi:hypothetical protein
MSYESPSARLDHFTALHANCESALAIGYESADAPDSVVVSTLCRGCDEEPADQCAALTRDGDPPRP